MKRPVFLVLCIVAMMSLVATSAFADAWLGDRTCASFQACRSTSVTSGTPGSFPANYTVHEQNNARSPEWDLTQNRRTRQFTSQTGQVEVFIFTTGTLHSQSATCVCVATPCPI